WTFSLASLTEDGLKVTNFDQNGLDAGPASLKTLVTLLQDLSDQEALVRVTLTPMPTLTPAPTSTKLAPTPTPTQTPAATLRAGTTQKPTREPEQWGHALTEEDTFINLDVLATSDDVFIGAVKRFQMHPGEAPKDCVVFIIRGPMALATGFFGPGWVEIRH